MSGVVEVENLHKAYGQTLALNGFAMSVEPGEVHGFLGPNGAGKTTTIRILLGLIRADSGRVSVLGGEPWTDAVDIHRRLAYVPGDVALWPNITGGEVIDLLGRLRGGLDPKRTASFIDLFDLDPTKKGRAYSKGNRQKVALVAALASHAELLILDEPTAGLDPLMEAEFRTQVKAIQGEGRTVLLASHILGEVEALCDKVSIIRDGINVETGSISEMRKLSRLYVDARVDDAAGAAKLGQVEGVSGLTVNDHSIQCEVDPAALSELLNQLAPLGVQHLESRTSTLEELFLRHYESGSRS